MLLLYIILFGFIPPVLWLVFWVKEDPHPEPRKEILAVFFAGMAIVALAVFLENYFFKSNQLSREAFGYSPAIFQIVNLLGFAFIEEICKMLAVIFTALRSKYFDEPIDAMIYMVTAAMGFAALENILFIADSLQYSVNQTILVSAFRFINAILLHASTAILIGAGFAFSYFHHERRWKELGGAIVFSTLLHASYNFFIINNTDNIGENFGQIIATGLVLLGAVAGLFLFERARRIINI
ncbi:MAG: PrsW family glutamic-type intramembrane protease [bacterium]|nr:PrsW family glutamic-type intramembrane protease [bacterium]